MSDVMLHGVLCMPPGLWQDTDLDRDQRYSCYLQASRRIEDDDRELEQLRAENVELRKRCEEWAQKIATAKSDVLREAWRKFAGVTDYPSASDIQWELLRMADEYLATLKESKL